jgi:phosphopantetheinyl transferase
MTEPFYIGLSWMSILNNGREGIRQIHKDEGRRILSLLDTDNGLSHEPGGRPYFQDRHADFSISHSRNMAVAAWLSNPDPARTPCRLGCDIQYVDPRKPRTGISRRFLHECERAYIEEAGSEAIRNFYRIWVLKEAWLKLHGLGVFEIVKAPAFSIGAVDKAGQDGNGQNGNEQLDFFLYELAQPGGLDSVCGEMYALAICRQRNHFSGTAPEFRWFSETTLTLNRVENIYAAQSPDNTVTPKI